MSQPVGQTYKSRVPSFGDDASIVEALHVYHYGVDNYTTQPIPDDSIEGNFRSINSRVTTVEGQISALGTTYVEQVSLSATPNIITGQTTTTVPITIRGITSQSVDLQQWQNSSSTVVGKVSTAGYLSIAGYQSIGSTTQSTSTALNISIITASHTGLGIKAQSSQTGNLQEWQDSSGTAMSWVDKDGIIYSRGSEVGGGPGSFFLMGA